MAYRQVIVEVLDVLFWGRCSHNSGDTTTLCAGVRRSQIRLSRSCLTEDDLRRIFVSASASVRVLVRVWREGVRRGPEPVRRPVAMQELRRDRQRRREPVRGAAADGGGHLPAAGPRRAGLPHHLPAGAARRFTRPTALGLGAASGTITTGNGRERVVEGLTRSRSVGLPASGERHATPAPGPPMGSAHAA